MLVGTLAEVWRYPVKSMAGERVERTTLWQGGIPGDREWCVRDETAGEMRGAKKIAGLLHCAAAYRTEPGEAGEDVPSPVDITLPDGRRVGSDDAGVDGRLSEALGRPVTLWSRRPKTDLAHYRRGIPDFAGLDAELRDIFGLEPEEPIGDLSTLPPDLFEYTSPLGTYFDVAPLHLVTTASIDALRRLLPVTAVEARRFRPNLLVATGDGGGDGAEGFMEAAWTGRDVRVGGALLRMDAPAIRCVMTTRSQPDLPEDRRIMRALVRAANQNLGQYASVVTPGEVAVGDAVELL